MVSFKFTRVFLAQILAVYGSEPFAALQEIFLGNPWLGLANVSRTFSVKLMIYQRDTNDCFSWKAESFTWAVEGLQCH